MKNKLCDWGIALTVSLGTAACVQAGSTIQFTATHYTVDESAATATLNVQRTGDTAMKHRTSSNCERNTG